ncbi:unnamed protein product [Paramecium octaurelia]|uniref:Protein kinase domain-containing protein n=1 Tax=Paramecium octaurelia TaxID=43137 RepID=A0A8S1TSV0_PAROT|nr:unnamed protein product [Paramecium octaurelia]
MRKNYIIIDDRERSRSKEKQTKPVQVIDLEESCYSLDKGDIIGGKYKYLERINEGTFGRVIKVRDVQSNNQRALKIIKNSFHDYEKEYQAVQFLNLFPKLIDHPGRHHIVKVYDFFYHKQCQCILMEALGPSLYESLIKKRFTSQQVKSIMQQLLNAIDYMHELQYLHTDIKLENILFKSQFDEVNVKIIDFGNVVYGRQFYKGLVNTEEYRAPEVILGLEWNSKQDIWCLGCLMHEMFFQKELFGKLKNNNQKHLLMIEYLNGPFPQWMIKDSKFFSKGRVISDQFMRQGISFSHLSDINIHSSFIELLRWMLKTDPKERPSAKELLKHNYFKI